MPEENQVTEKTVRTYRELLTLIYDTAIKYRDSIVCCGEYYHAEYRILLRFKDNGKDVTIAVKDTDSGWKRNKGLMHLLLLDGYGIQPPEPVRYDAPGYRAFAYGLSTEDMIIIHDKIIRDFEAEDRNKAERKRQSRNEILKWGLGYVIASILTILGTIILHWLIHTP